MIFFLDSSYENLEHIFYSPKYRAVTIYVIVNTFSE